VRYRVLVRLPAPLAARDAREAMARRIADPGVRVASYDEAQPGLRRFFSQLASYLGLVGLASLLVGGIGVASSVATFVRRQAPTIAILKALGADSRTVLATFLWQTLTVGAAASVAGAVLGTALQPVLIRLLAGLVPFTLEARVEPLTLARGVLMGVLTTFLCALWPLLAVRTVRPSLILRAEVDAAPARGPRPWAVALPVAAGLAALALWQAGSLKLGGIFLGAAVAAVITPLVRARLAAVNGVRVTRDLVRSRVGEDREGAFYYTREYALTWSAEPPPGTVLTRGRWWGPDPGPARISVEEAMARQLGVDVGGRLTFDVP